MRKRAENKKSVTGKGALTAHKSTAPHVAALVKEPAVQTYLTKRILIKAVADGFKAAAAATMKIQGFNIVAENGWVIKVYADGTKEKIKKIQSIPRPKAITLK